MDWKETIRQHQATFSALSQYGEVIEAMGDCLIQALRNSGTIFIAGNGGSAADAQHFAAELTGRFLKERRALAGIALTTDTSALTAIGNDYGFDVIFSRQLAGLSRAGDVLIGISTSGNSPNILRALEFAKEKQLTTIGLTGRDGGKMRDLCDICCIVPSHVTAHIQEAHIFIIHYLCAMIDSATEDEN